MWERGSTLRAELSAVDISWCVVARAERAMAAEGCAWAGLALAALVALVAPAARLVQVPHTHTYARTRTYPHAHAHTHTHTHPHAHITHTHTHAWWRAERAMAAEGCAWAGLTLAALVAPAACLVQVPHTHSHNRNITPRTVLFNCLIQ